MGQTDFIPEAWPDPAEMNRQLHAMNIETMISIWPRFKPGTHYYDTVKQNGWFLHHADGTPEDGRPYDSQGSDIDTTSPDAAKWYWGIVCDDIVSKGFDSFWAEMRPNRIFLRMAVTSALDRGRSTSMYGKVLLLLGAAFIGSASLPAENAATVLERDGYTVALEPYAPNIIRVTMSVLNDQSMAGPGYRIVATPATNGWLHEVTTAGDTYRSPRMTVIFPPQFLRAEGPMVRFGTAPERASADRVASHFSGLR